MQVKSKQPEVLTEEHFSEAEKRQVSQKFSKDELQLIKQNLVGQPVWPQNLPFEELQQGRFACWGEYVAWCCLKAW